MTTKTAELGNAAGMQAISLSLGQRGVQREKWKKDFEDNFSVVADKVSESATREVLGKLRERLADPYKRLPTTAYPLDASVSLDLRKTRAVSRLQSLAGEKAELSPFKEWFAAFGPKEKPADLDLDGKAGKLSSFFYEDSRDLSYFEEQMARIGRRLETKVKEQLSAFAARAGNESLRYKVEWYRKAERLITNPSNMKDNVLYVTTWIETKK